MPTPPWCGLVLWSLWCCPALFAADERDAAIQAATRALAAGQPVAALQVLSGHATAGTLGTVRLLESRALLALGRPQDAARRLGIGDATAITAWPGLLQAQASALAGEIALASGDLVGARAHLERALQLHGEGLTVDRVMVLLAECGERLGDTVLALRYAHALWRDWPRSPFRARAGVIEARLIAGQQPDQARTILAGVRVLDQIEPGTRLMAGELLCHLLLPTRPGQCLVVAEQDLSRLTQHGRLPIYRALALSAMDAREGLEALQALPAAMREDPAVSAAIQRLNSQPASQSHDANLRIERARAELELGRVTSARTMLEPLASTWPAALILLANIDDVALERWLEVPAMAHPTARAALGIALSRRGDHARAWPLLQPLVTPVQAVDGITPASLLYWAAGSAQQVAPERVAELNTSLLALDGHTLETGLAWAVEAQRREQTAALAESVRAAWERAAEDLPADHPWQPIAVLRAARPLIAMGNNLAHAKRLLERVQGTASEDQRRCRFMLAQVYERLALTAAALQIIDELQAQADAEQVHKLTRMRARLMSPGASEVQPRPLDAEN